ncbi:MAG: hypothetical protein ABR990_05645 [Terracidiphilus sp.]|jgi:SOS-response transcriptional repressor LexA
MEKFDQFHDGYLDGLLIQGVTVRVFLSTEDRQEFVLEVSGVVSLKVDGFRQGNMIFDVVIRKGDDITIRDIVDVFEFKDEEKALKKLEDARRMNLIVLEINPSYGASCMILAEFAKLLPRYQ